MHFAPWDKGQCPHGALFHAVPGCCKGFQQCRIAPKYPNSRSPSYPTLLEALATPWDSVEHRVIILLERACLHNRIGRNWCKFPDQDVQRHSVTSFETARSLANDTSGGELRGNYPGIAASPISLLSMGGVCGRSLTAGKILFTGSQTCSLYLVLWLCGVEQCSMGTLSQGAKLHRLDQP